MEAKMAWTNSDIEKDNISKQLKDIQQKLRDAQSSYTMMEVELYKINEKFGQTLNMNNELEMEIHRMQAEKESTPKKKSKFSFFRKKD
jgi:hypothetical protein